MTAYRTSCMCPKFDARASWSGHDFTHWRDRATTLRKGKCWVDVANPACVSYFAADGASERAGSAAKSTLPLRTV